MIQEGESWKFGYNMLIYELTIYYRDALVSAAVGTTSFNGVTYSTTSEMISGLLPAGSTGVNHGKT
jgi:hypothetical protein